MHAGSAFLAFVGGTKPRRRLYGSLYKAPGDVKVCGGEGSGSLTQMGLAADVSVIPSLICVVFSFGTLVAGCASRAHLGISVVSGSSVSDVRLAHLNPLNLIESGERNESFIAITAGK